MTSDHGGPVGQRRRRRVTVTREEVLDAAIAITDEEGLNALTIRAVASRLDLSPMSIYRFADSKEHLLDEMIVRVLSRLEPPHAISTSWTESVIATMSGFRDVVLEHPSLVQVMLERPVPAHSEGLIRLEEAVLAALEDGGVVGDAAVVAFWQILSTAAGHLVFERARSPLSVDDQATAGAAMARVALERKFARVAALAERLTSLEARGDYETAVRTLLRGIAATTDAS